MWPENLTMGSIKEWPRKLLTPSQRQVSKFKVNAGDGSYRRKSTPLSDTLEVLDRELAFLNAKDRVMLVAIPPHDFRIDGKPRAQAKAEHPGVILSFTTKHGALSYAVDTFTTWQDNLRGIALGLEALRKVDRYGVTQHGEQYRGFLAIEAGGPSVIEITDAQHALRILFDAAEMIVEDGVIYPKEDLAFIGRKAKRKTHPDTNGGVESDLWLWVNAAEDYLRRAGAL